MGIFLTTLETRKPNLRGIVSFPSLLIEVSSSGIQMQVSRIQSPVSFHYYTRSPEKKIRCVFSSLFSPLGFDITFSVPIMPLGQCLPLQCPHVPMGTPCLQMAFWRHSLYCSRSALSLILSYNSFSF